MSLMPLFLTAVLLILGCQSSGTTSTVNANADIPFTWLIGTWKHTEHNAWETWELAEDQISLLGAGYRVIAEGDTVMTERLQIILEDGDYYYVADVGHNPAPVYFRIVEITEFGFKSENPEHDFPQFIHYDRIDEDNLTAAIGAGERRIAFRFVRQ